MPKRADYRANKVRDVELGTAWVPHSAELLPSAAWRTRSIHCARLLDRIELEHMAHAGKENGYLIVTYDQFVEWGIGRRFIRAAIEEAVKRGLLVVERHGAYRGGARRQPSLYRLTYLRFRFVPIAGAPYFVNPTNDWRDHRDPPKKSSRMVTRGEPSKCTGGEPSLRSRDGSGIARMADFIDSGRS
jgi:GNAT superfamily N-acetyltransferase